MSAETTHPTRNVHCLQNLCGFPNDIVFIANLCLEKIITHHILIVFGFRYRGIQTYLKCSFKTITVTVTLFLLSRALCNKRRHIKSIQFYIYKTEIQFMLKRKQAERWTFIVRITTTNNRSEGIINLGGHLWNWVCRTLFTRWSLITVLHTYLFISNLILNL